MLQQLPPNADSISSPEEFTYPFCYRPHPLCQIAAKEVIDFCYHTPEMYPREGKMFGVLIVEKDGKRYYLRAFSGIYNGSYHHEGFVPPVYDLQDKEGYFHQEEQRISQITVQLKDTEDETKKVELKALRKEKSHALQMWTFQQFRMLNARHQTADLMEIFKDYKSPFSVEEYVDYMEGRTPQKPKSKQGIPPGGAGECCAPKLLQYAFLHDLKPICMGEFWVGPSKVNEMRIEGNFYPSCQSKCVPILSYMMQGLEVEDNPMLSRGQKLLRQVHTVFEDEDLMVVYKPSGLLSVPSKNVNEVSLQTYLMGVNPDIRLAHRLDQDTSGLIIASKNVETYRKLQQQFTQHEVEKKYVALLGEPVAPLAYSTTDGIISLPLSRNPFDAPRQVVDQKFGKEAITRYHFTDADRVELYPETGRTHQLRVHCAHPEGLARPIKGDVLYGTPSDRLYLHAESISFKHPRTGEVLHYEEKDF